jgi:hypothetical protein
MDWYNNTIRSQKCQGAQSHTAYKQQQIMGRNNQILYFNTTRTA